MRRRDTIKTHQIRLKNQLHEQLCVVYPSYKKFFSDISRQTALYFFQKYPSPDYLSGKTTEELAEELRVPSHNNCSTKKCSKILELVATDGITKREYQSSRDDITRSIIADLQHYNEHLVSVEDAVKKLYPTFECTLMSEPGIDLIMACKLLAEIGDIKRFPNVNKLAKLAGVAPVTFSSAGKGSNLPSKQGNRRLQAIFYFLAIQMIQVSLKGTVRNAIFREYYVRRSEHGKNNQQVIICIARRLVNIVYGMLKNKTEYRDPNRTNEKSVETAV